MVNLSKEVLDQIKPSYMTFDRYEDSSYYSLMHFNSAISMLSTLLAIYFIICKSPSAIGNYKWYLFNISAMSFVFDFAMTFIYLPQPLFPSLVMCTKGLLQPFGFVMGGLLGFYMFIGFFGMCSMSVTWAFAYRLFLLTNKEHFINSALGISIIALTQIFYETPTIVLYGISTFTPSHEYVLEIAYAKFPKIKPFVHNKSCAVVAFEANNWALAFMISCALQFSFNIPVNLALLYASFHTLHKRQAEMSAKTAKMHRQLLRSLIWQMLVPFCTLLVPFSIMSVLVLLQVENVEFFMKLLFLVGTLHSFFNSLAMIFHIHPYRNAARAMVMRCLMRRKHTTTPVTTIDGNSNKELSTTK
ncbi:serpentine type 7TM GPCR chemoreceptor srh domain-containing protein [Ditylenchus destructor]|nr:serpentine type 7TM GPCR chemoreceptor srh domain-containing protein [Ditylenchus destructor]